MKKVVLICALAAAFCAGAVQMMQVKDLKQGELDVKGAGRLALVEVVSPTKSGTVTLSRVITCDVFTNVYETSVSTSVVVSLESVTTNRYFNYATNGAFAATYLYTSNYTFETVGGGKVRFGFNDSQGRDYWYILAANGTTNAQVRAEDVGFDAHSVNFGPAGLLSERMEYLAAYSTNVTVSVLTNSATPVLKEHNAITNQILNGSCSGGYYGGFPTNAWMFSGDHLIFEGTATGGLLRLVVE